MTVDWPVIPSAIPRSSKRSMIAPVLDFLLDRESNPCIILSVNKLQSIMICTVVGSGGVHPIPVVGCNCRLCSKARLKNGAGRHGPSVFLENEKVLFDTPEDIQPALNEAGIIDIQHIIFSHWHPDHVMGFRIVEALANNILLETVDPIDVYIPKDSEERFRYMIPALWYFLEQGIVRIHTYNEDCFTINGLQIQPVKLMHHDYWAFILKENDTHALICMDHVMELPEKDMFKNIDLFIMNMGFLEKNLINGVNLPVTHKLRSTTGFEKDNIRLIRDFQPRRSIFIHIEHLWNRDVKELGSLAAQYSDIQIEFSYDGMRIEI